eukprot:12401352-Karenia_brevis.AAC.1
MCQLGTLLRNSTQASGANGTPTHSQGLISPPPGSQPTPTPTQSDGSALINQLQNVADRLTANANAASQCGQNAGHGSSK